MIYKLTCSIYAGRYIEYYELPSKDYQGYVSFRDMPSGLDFELLKALIVKDNLIAYVYLTSGGALQLYDVKFMVVDPNSTWKVYHYKPVTYVPKYEEGIKLATGIVVHGQDLSAPFVMEHEIITLPYAPGDKKEKPPIPFLEQLPFGMVSPEFQPGLPIPFGEEKKEPPSLPWWLILVVVSLVVCSIFFLWRYAYDRTQA